MGQGQRPAPQAGGSRPGHSSIKPRDRLGRVAFRFDGSSLRCLGAGSARPAHGEIPRPVVWVRSGLSGVIAPCRQRERPLTLRRHKRAAHSLPGHEKCKILFRTGQSPIQGCGGLEALPRAAGTIGVSNRCAADPEGRESGLGFFLMQRMRAALTQKSPFNRYSAHLARVHAVATSVTGLDGSEPDGRLLPCPRSPISI